MTVTARACLLLSLLAACRAEPNGYAGECHATCESVEYVDSEGGRYLCKSPDCPAGYNCVVLWLERQPPSRGLCQLACRDDADCPDKKDGAGRPWFTCVQPRGTELDDPEVGYCEGILPSG